MKVTITMEFDSIEAAIEWCMKTGTRPNAVSAPTAEAKTAEVATAVMPGAHGSPTKSAVTKGKKALAETIEKEVKAANDHLDAKQADLDKNGYAGNGAAVQEQLVIPETKAPPTKVAKVVAPDPRVDPALATEIGGGAKSAFVSPKPTTPPMINGIALPEDVRNAANMRELLVYLKDHGVADIEAMVTTCVDIGPTVPLLTRVKDIPTRVRAAVKVLALFDAETDEQPTA